MPRSPHLVFRFAMLAALLCGGAVPAVAQKHSSGSAPPTAPPLPVTPARPLAQPAPVVRQTPSGVATHLVPPLASSSPIAAISTGLGAIQFVPGATETPAPQTLMRQLSTEDERARLGALSSLGAPAQYLARGHVPVPHSMQLDLLQLGNSDELDALLTVELDQHVVSAILVPDGLGWRRVATVSFASSFSEGATTPSNFVRPLRSWLQPGRYRAVYHATVNGPNGDFVENEADVRILNGRAVVLISFVSGARQCDLTGQLRPPHQTCEVLQRWLDPDPADPTHRFTLVTGVGHSPAREGSEPLQSRNYRLTRLRSFACQPFAFADGGSRLEPLANSSACPTHEGPGGGHPDHTGLDHPAANSATSTLHSPGEHSATTPAPAQQHPVLQR